VAPAVAAKSAECPCVKPRCICWKKIIIFILGIALGVGACIVYMGCPHLGGAKRQAEPKAGHHQRRASMFVDGCLDLTKIEDSERLERIQARIERLNLDTSGCITREELFPDRPEGGRGPRGEGGGHGPRGPRQ
jgi:hypothetical protein